MCIASYKHSWIVVGGITIIAYISEDYDNYTVIKYMYIKLGLNPIKYDVTNVTSYVRSKFSGSRFINWNCKNMFARGLQV